ncbi:hypothetical protein Tco_0458207 [Tanacetum coccineum]
MVSEPRFIENQVMAALVISILSNTSEESVGSHAPRVILFGVIPAIIPVIHEVPVVLADLIVASEEGTVLVVSPAGVLYLVDYSPSFDSESIGGGYFTFVTDLRRFRPSYVLMTRRRTVSPSLLSRRPVSSSHDTLAPLSEFPLAHVVAPPGIHRNGLQFFSSVRGEAIFSVRTSIAPTSMGHDPRTCEAFRRWRSAPLSTPYPPTTSESSLGSSSERSLDSSSPSSRPSRKRCRGLEILSPQWIAERRYGGEVDTVDAEAVADVGISEGAHPEDGVGMGFEIAASNVREDDEEFEVEASAADTREIAVDPLVIGDSSESSFRGGKLNGAKIERSG